MEHFFQQNEITKEKTQLKILRKIAPFFTKTQKRPPETSPPKQFSRILDKSLNFKTRKDFLDQKSLRDCKINFYTCNSNNLERSSRTRHLKKQSVGPYDDYMVFDEKQNRQQFSYKPLLSRDSCKPRSKCKRQLNVSQNKLNSFKKIQFPKPRIKFRVSKRAFNKESFVLGKTWDQCDSRDMKDSNVTLKKGNLLGNKK